MTDKEKTLAFIEGRIKWNEDMMQRDPKPSDIGRIEEAKCIRRFIDSLQEEPVSEDLEDPCSCCQGFCNKEKCDELIFGYRCPVLNVIQSLELGFENAVEKASEWLKDFCNEHYIMSYTDSSEVVYEKLIEIFKSKMKEDK